MRAGETQSVSRDSDATYRKKNSRNREIRAVASSKGCADSSSRLEAEKLLMTTVEVRSSPRQTVKQTSFVRESADDRQEAERRATAVAFTIVRIDDRLLDGAVHPFAARPTVRHPLIVIRKPSARSD